MNKTEEIKDFEFIAHNLGYNITSKLGIYTDDDTQMLRRIWCTARSENPKKLREKWDSLRLKSNQYVGKLQEVIKAAENTIDGCYSNLDLSRFMENEKSTEVIESVKWATKKRMIDTIKNTDKLVGVEYLVCGLKEVDHKRVRAKIRKIIDNLTAPLNSAYCLEITVTKEVSKSLFIKDYHGLRLSSSVLDMVDSYGEALPSKECNA